MVYYKGDIMVRHGTYNIPLYILPKYRGSILVPWYHQHVPRYYKHSMVYYKGSIMVRHGVSRGTNILWYTTMVVPWYVMDLPRLTMVVPWFYRGNTMAFFD